MFAKRQNVLSLFVNILTLVSLNGNGVIGLCPEAQYLKPCTCDAGANVFCDNVSGQLLKETFIRISKRQNIEKRFHFHLLRLTGSAVTQLPEHTFADINIDEIQIKNAINLKTIHTNAFQGTQRLTSRLVLQNCPKLAIENLYEILNKFRSILSIKLVGLMIVEIPSQAFKTLRRLSHLELAGPYIKKIGEKAFFNLNSLSSLHIHDTSISHISANVFVFSRESNQFLTISLYKNKLMNGTSFTPNTFSQTGRPTSIDFSGFHYTEQPYHRKQVTFLDEKVFRHFLKLNEWNEIELFRLQINCKDCRNFWIHTTREFQDKLSNIKCIDGKTIYEHPFKC